MSANIETLVGTPLPERTKIARNVHRREDRKTEQNIHDDSAAQKMGFSRGFVAGGQSIGMLSEIILDFLGPAYLESGRFQASYVSPVYEEDKVILKGVVRERVPEDGGVRLVCDVWIEKEDGAKAVAGTASAVLK